MPTARPFRPTAVSAAAALAWAAGAVVLPVAGALAQFSSDPATNLLVSDRAGGFTQPFLRPAPGGGFWLSWLEGAGFDVYLQRFNAAGVAQIPGDITVADRNFSSVSGDYDVLVDPAGDVYIAFVDDRPPVTGTSGQIAVMKFGPAGEPRFASNGVHLTADDHFKLNPRLALLSDGNIVVGWSADPPGNNPDQLTYTRFQRMSSTGALLLGTTVTVQEDGRPHTITGLVAGPDASFAAMYIRASSRFVSAFRQLVAQRYDAAGAPMWGAGEGRVYVFGNSAVTIDSIQVGATPRIVPDGAGGFATAWTSTTAPRNAYIQHVRGDGALAFPGPFPLGNSGLVPIDAAVAFEPADGSLLAAWAEDTNSTPRLFGVFAQRVNAAGVAQWPAGGVVIQPMSAPQPSFVSVLRTPGTDGATIGYQTLEGQAGAVRATRLDGSGDPVWPGSPIFVSSNPAPKLRLAAATLAGGDFVFAWGDTRNDPNPFGNQDLFVQNVRFASGALGAPAGPAACNAADIVSIGGFPPADGELTVDDYTSFINAFAGDELLADIVAIGGFPPADGELTVDDYTSFINAFAEGCPG